MKTIAFALTAIFTCLVFDSTVGAQPADHLQCYKIRDATQVVGTIGLDVPALGVDPACTVSTARLFCTPAARTAAHVTDRSTGLGIAPLPASGPDPGARLCYTVKCEGVVADQSVTDPFGSRTVSRLKASLVCTPAFVGSARYVDNGDGTVTDRYTNLQWEKKDGADGVVDVTNPHDVDNTYSWTGLTGCVFSGCPNGTAFVDFLGRLNSCTNTGTGVFDAGFAGHCDWRLPTIGELGTLVDLDAPGCTAGSPCIDPTFGPTNLPYYWASTGVPFNASFVWVQDFVYGFSTIFPNGASTYARAVRRAS